MMWDNFYYGVCYYPEHWDPKRHPSDIARMADAGFNCVRLGEGAWSYWEPEEGRFQFEMFDRVIDLCRKHGIKVIMGTPTYCAPAWVPTRYPEVLRWNYERVPMAHGSRRNFNYTSPKYYELSDRVCTALAEHYAREKQIIGWQLDNEFNCHMEVSYAPSDTLAFQAWLKDKYRTIERLNDAWGTRFWSQTYDSWDQIDLPHPTPTYPNPTHYLDETRFISDCVVRFAQRQADILRQHNPNWRITHNGLFPNVNGPDLAGVLDFFCHDHYPLFARHWHEFSTWVAGARAFSFPFGIMEQQSGPGGQTSYMHRTPRPGEMRLWAWQSIAHGAKLVNFFRWRTCPYGAEQHWHGLLDADDRDNRRLAEAKQLGGEFRKLPRAFLDAPVVKCIAVMRDFDNEANDRRVNTYTKEGQGEHTRWLGELAGRHIPADIVWPSMDVGGYRAVILPHLKIITKELAAKLTQYVQAGGTLILGAQSGLKDINCHVVEMPLPGLLRKLAGVEVEDWTMLAPGETREARFDGGPSLSLFTFVERLKPATAQVLARWMTADPLLASAPAITLNVVGKGSVYYIGGYCPAPAISTLLEQVLSRLDIQPIAQASPEVEILARTDGRKRWLCLLNHSPLPQRVAGLGRWQNLLSGAAGDDELVLDPLDVAVVRG